MQLEGGVFLSQFIQGNSHLILVGASLWLNSDINDRLWEGDRFKNDGMIAVAERITGEGVTQTDSGTDISRSNLIDILTVIGMHAQQAADALRFVLCAILDSPAFVQGARVDTQIRKTAHEGVRDNLEDKGTEGS